MSGEGIIAKSDAGNEAMIEVGSEAMDYDDENKENIDPNAVVSIRKKECRVVLKRSISAPLAPLVDRTLTGQDTGHVFQKTYRTGDTEEDDVEDVGLIAVKQIGDPEDVTELNSLRVTPLEFTLIIPKLS